MFKLITFLFIPFFKYFKGTEQKQHRKEKQLVNIPLKLSALHSYLILRSSLAPH